MDAIGAGLLSAFGNFGLGLGGAMDQRRKDALDREKLEQDRSLRQQVIDQQASQFAATQRGLSTPAEQLFGYIGLPLPPGVQPDQLIPNTIADNLISNAQKQQQVAREQQMQTGTAAFLRGAQGRPGQPAELMGQLAEGEDPEAAALIPRSANVPAVAPMGRAEMAAGLAEFGHKDAGLKALMDSVFGEKAAAVTHAPPGSGILDPRGNLIGTVPALPKEPKFTAHTIATREGVFEVIRDEQGNEVSRTRAGSPVQEPREPREPREAPRPTATETILDLTRQRQALQRQGVPDTDPRIMDLNGQLESIGGTRYQPKTVAPTARERIEMADLRTTIGGLESLVKDVDANKDVLGGLFSNPTGAIRRGLSDYVPSMTTPEEKKFLGKLGTQVAQFKQELIGKQQTIPELKGLVDLLPEKGLVDISVVPRLQAIRELLQRKLREREAIFGGGGGGDPKVISYDAQGNPIR